MLSHRLARLAAGLSLMAAAPAAAQLDGTEVGQIIGRAIAAGIVLATDDFTSAGSFDFDDDTDSRFQVRQIGGRHRFARSSRWEPFVGARVGQVLIDQRLGLGGDLSAPLEFDVWGVAVEGGTRLRFGDGWFGQIRGEAAYDFADNHLVYPDAAIEAVLGPQVDGILVNWQVEALTLEAGMAIGWQRRSAWGFATALEAEVVALRTDPVEVDDPVQDVTVETHFERLAASVEMPLDVSTFGRPLRLEARARHTFLGADLAEPLDSKGFTDLRLALLTPKPNGSRLPIQPVGFALTYTTAAAFEGWSVGMTFGR